MDETRRHEAGLPTTCPIIASYPGYLLSVRYCGRDFSDEELHQIRQLIAENPTCHRAQLSRMTCQALQWYKADGGLKEMSARVAMLRMQDDGLITLPPPRRARPDPTVRPDRLHRTRYAH